MINRFRALKAPPPTGHMAESLAALFQGDDSAATNNNHDLTTRCRVTSRIIIANAPDKHDVWRENIVAATVTATGGLRGSKSVPVSDENLTSGPFPYEPVRHTAQDLVEVHLE